MEAVDLSIAAFLSCLDFVGGADGLRLRREIQNGGRNRRERVGRAWPSSLLSRGFGGYHVVARGACNGSTFAGLRWGAAARRVGRWAGAITQACEPRSAVGGWRTLRIRLGSPGRRLPSTASICWGQGRAQ